jgi:flagellar motor protein MotB
MRASQWSGTIIVLVGIASVGAGCQNKVAEENKQLWQQNRELQSQLTETGDKLKAAPDPAQMAAMQKDIADRDAKIADLQNQLRTPTPSAGSQTGIEGIETSFDPKAGTMTVNVPGDVLFASGQATLKDSAKATLNKVAGAIKKDYAGKKIIVDGHTDSDPISKTKDKWEDNLDLSAARARAVAQYLVSQGVPTNLVKMRALADTAPRGDKAKSRRVEIVVATR